MLSLAGVDNNFAEVSYVHQDVLSSKWVNRFLEGLNYKR